MPEKKSRNFIANWENWKTVSQELDRKAKIHRKQSYFKVDKRGYKDLFDALRSTLWINRNSKAILLTGIMWNPAWNDIKSGIIPEDTEKGSFGHSFAIIGQKRINNQWYLVAQLSNGQEIGHNGYMYFPRKVVNEELRFGNFIFKDIEPDKIKQDWSAYQKFVDRLRKKFLELKALL